MIISVHELNEHDNLHFSGDFGFCGNFKGFLVISLVVTVEKLILHTIRKLSKFIHKITYTILYDTGILGLNELDNVRFDLASILNIFC